MNNIKDFFSKHFKIIIVLILLIVILLAIFFINRKKYKLEEYVKQKYDYFAMYSTDDKVGVVDKTGKLILEPIYSDVFILNPTKPVFVCYEANGNYKILDENNKELFSKYEKVEALQTSELDLDFEKVFLKFKKNDKYGLIDYEGNEVVSADYDEITSLKYRPGEILVKKEDKYGVIGSDGKIKIEVKYDSIIGDEYYTEKYAYGETGYIVGEKTSEGFLYGYLNNYGEKVLENKFESITRVLNYNDSVPYLIVMNNGKNGVYKNNKKIIDQNYQGINYIDNSNLFIVKRNSKYGFFGVNGKEILPVNYTAYTLAGDYISVSNEDGKKELYDVNGNKVSNLNYKDVKAAGKSGCYIAVDDKGEYSIITSSETIADSYKYVSYAFDNYFIFQNEFGKYGLLNIYSGVEIEPEYNFMLVVDGKNAIEAKKEDNTVDIYSKDLEKTVIIKDAVIENINKDYAIVHSNSDMKYIDKNGKIVENTKVFKDNKLYTYSENGKWGYKDSKGKIVIKASYDFATDLNEYGFAGIVKEGKWGIINLDGKVIKEPAFELETYYLPEFVGKYLLELTDTYHCLELEK